MADNSVNNLVINKLIIIGINTNFNNNFGYINNLMIGFDARPGF